MTLNSINCLITIVFILSPVLVECTPKIPPASVGRDWYCETICAGGCGGKPLYSEDDNICHCTITEHIDDGDMSLIQKTAGVIGMTIKFDGPKHKRAVDDSKDDKKYEDKDETTTTKKFVLKPLKPLFPHLRARFQLTNPSDTNVDEEEAGEPILGQMDPRLIEEEPHHNVYAPPSLFRSPLLGQMKPSVRDYEPHHNIVAPPLGAHGKSLDHLTPALTRSMLMNVRDKLDHLILRTAHYPYQPAVTAHETESMRNTLKQITQVNVNVRPVGTTFGYFFNNLVNQLIPAAGNLLRQEAPNSTDTNVEGEMLETATNIEMIKSTTNSSKLKKLKEPLELDKKTSMKTTTTTSTTCQSTTTVAKFLPEEDGDELVGEDADYDYEEPRDSIEPKLQ